MKTMKTKHIIFTAAISALAVVSCKKEDPKADFQPITQYQNSIPEFYNPVKSGDTYGANTPDYTIIANVMDQVRLPNDLDFNTTAGKENELWIVNEGTVNSGSTNIIIQNAGQDNQMELYRKDGNSWHFMSLSTALAFSEENGNFGTSPGVYDANHNGGAPFTGPSLWSSDLSIFAQYAGAGTNGSHLDMLHESPYCMGIASEVDNAFWVFDGDANNIVKYDFKDDHGAGMHDHSDAVIARYTEASVTRKSGVPSHMILDKKTGWLYICDTGGKRIMRLRISAGNIKRNLTMTESVSSYVEMENAEWEVFATSNLVDPCGIEISENRLFVSDNATNEIIAYDLGSKEELGRLQTTATNIRGIKVGPNGKLWYVDYSGNKVVRIDPK
jgi:hypothetical protein